MTERTLFESLPISDEVKRAVADMGFEEATYIQSQSIPLVMAGHDVIGHSQTGTGKTAAFGIPVIERITQDATTQALILCPTRELAIQCCEEMRKFAKYKHGIKIVPIYGGQHIDRQINSLKKGAEVVIGTPGRIMDHMRRHTLKLQNLATIVLDEADEMLNMGFREDIETILQDVPTARQTILFSATMPPEIMQIANNYQANPQIIKMVRNELTVPAIQQHYYEVPSAKKVEALARLLDFHNPTRSIVFCNTKRMVDELVDELQFRGYAPDGLHGDMKQESRTTVMNAFKSGKVDILVATDVAARGIDVDDIDAVFNYDLPQDEEYYIHRIGRTGRAGKTGASYTFVSTRRQISELKSIENHIKSKIVLKTVPSISEVSEVRNDKLIERLTAVLHNNSYRNFESLLDKLMESDFTTSQIASAALCLLSENNNNENIHFDRQLEKPAKKVVKGPPPPGGMVRFILSLGNNDKVTARHIVGTITGECGVPGNTIGSIVIYNCHSIVEISAKYAPHVVKKIKGCTINGKPVTLKPKRDKSKLKDFAPAARR